MKKEITPAQGTLELPYEVINEANIVSRKTIRELTANKETGYGRQTYYIKHSIIQWRPGFNGRIKPLYMSEEEWEEELEIETQAKDMLANGHIEPLKGDLLNDGTLFILTDGERRFRAISWLIRHEYTHYANGKEIAMVEVFLNPRETTEEERLLTMLGTDTKKKFKPLELGHMFLRLKRDFLYSHEKIGEIRNISRQQVDNMVKLALEPAEIQEALLKGTLTPTAAIELLNNEKDPVKRVEIVTGKAATGGTLKVKDAAQIAKYKEYHELFAAVLERYNDNLITADAAQIQLNEIGNTALTYLPVSEMKDIYSAWDNSSEVLTNNKANKEIDTIPEEEEREEDADTSDTDAQTIVSDEELADRFKEALTDFSTGKTDYLAATKAICNIGLEATKLTPKEEDAIETMQRTTIASLDQLKKLKDRQKVDTVDTKAANQAQENSGITSGTYQEPSRKDHEGDDALAAIDFKKDKEMGEMELNEAIVILDKLITKMGLFPANLKQYVDDVTGLAVVTQNKIKLGIEVIKKASDKR